MRDVRFRVLDRSHSLYCAVLARYHPAMNPDRDYILALLCEHRRSLADLGVVSIGLFGSAVRGELSATSDLDFLVRLRTNTFDAYMDVKEYLERLFERRIDLVLDGALKPALRDRIVKEAVHAEGF